MAAAESQLNHILAEAKLRAPNTEGVGCFLCKWIAEDIEKNGKLTDHPVYDQVKVFPREGKLKHLKAEGIIEDSHECDRCEEAKK